MANDLDIDSAIRGGTEDDQKKYGTIQENVYKLKEGMRELLTLGASNPTSFESMFLNLLHGYEVERMAQERNIKTLERKLEWCRARQQYASQQAAFLLGVISNKVKEAKATHTAPVPFQPPPDSDLAILQTICACGCRDEEDAKSCSCPCHKVGYCENPKCAVCPPKRTLNGEAKGVSEKRPMRRKPTPPSTDHFDGGK